MRVNFGRPPVPGGTMKKGSGVNDFIFIILETGGVCLENKFKLALENLEFMLISFVLFRVWDLRSLRGPGGHFIYLGAGSKDIATGGYYP